MHASVVTQNQFLSPDLKTKYIFLIFIGWFGVVLEHFMWCEFNSNIFLSLFGHQRMWKMVGHLSFQVTKCILRSEHSFTWNKPMSSPATSRSSPSIWNINVIYLIEPSKPHEKCTINQINNDMLVLKYKIKCVYVHILYSYKA